MLPGCFCRPSLAGSQERVFFDILANACDAVETRSRGGGTNARKQEEDSKREAEPAADWSDCAAQIRWPCSSVSCLTLRSV
eukprot:scaffold909_cov121-Isochrysis_galbana.AAC.15